MLRLICLLAAAAHVVTAQPTYKIPLAMSKVVAEDDSCILPEGFVVQSFQIWTPAPGNNRSDIIHFDYADNSTSILTECRFNGTSQNVGPAGLTPRYACDNTTVEFIWQNGTLTLVEKACPQNKQPRGFEAAGQVTPTLLCGASSKNSSIGAGTGCVAKERSLAANFTSLEPTPS